MKTSSLGDVIHNLPVVSDILRHYPSAQIDWCVEQSFAAIPALHPGVGRIMPVALRRWRKALFQWATWREIGHFRRQMAQQSYDAVIDTQGLLKSAVFARQARGPKSGYDAASAQEPLASRLYDRVFAIARQQHAVQRNRQLAAAALGYVAEGEPDYGIAAAAADFPWLPEKPCVVLLTATSRDDKLWPEDHWVALGEQLAAAGYAALLPAGNQIERARASRLAAQIPGAVVVPPLSLPELAALLAASRATVGVDTGLSHLAVALGVPTIALYTATDPGLTGVLGRGFWRNLGGKAQTPSVNAVMAAL
ncbi:MAG: lipopolysaccharide heptosyltransferase I, partial [Azonexus sp.]|nr:lipopolysaccharide heptosyltransferase I [Azonexus sp.]